MLNFWNWIILKEQISTINRLTSRITSRWHNIQFVLFYNFVLVKWVGNKEEATNEIWFCTQYNDMHVVVAIQNQIHTLPYLIICVMMLAYYLVVAAKK